MTASQLPLLERPEPRRLFGARIPGQPARAKHACTCRVVRVGTRWVGRPGTRPLDAWSEWRDAVVPQLQARWRHPPITTAVRARVVAVFQRPLEPRLTHTCKGLTLPYPYEWTDERVGFVGKPDWDQVYKAATDVLVHAGILLDDELVVGPFGGGRWYAAEGEGPCVEVSLWTP